MRETFSRVLPSLTWPIGAAKNGLALKTLTQRSDTSELVFPIGFRRQLVPGIAVCLTLVRGIAFFLTSRTIRSVRVAAGFVGDEHVPKAFLPCHLDILFHQVL